MYVLPGTYVAHAALASGNATLPRAQPAYLGTSSLLDSARDDVGDQEFSGVVIYAEVSCSRNDAIDLSKHKKNRSQS